MISPVISVVLIVAALLTSFVSGVFGMAGGMILMGLMTWALTVQQAMILHGITQLSSNGFRFLLHRAHIQWSLMATYFIGAFVCLGLFVWAAFVPEKVLVYLVLGFLPFFTYLKLSRDALDITKPGRAILCGFLVTAFQLTAGVSGPMLDIFYIKSPLTRHEVVATKAVTQTAGHFIKLVYFAVLVNGTEGAFDGLPIWLCVAVIPAAFVGTFSARRLLDNLSDDQFRKYSRLVITAIGIVYLGRAISLIVLGDG